MINPSLVIAFWAKVERYPQEECWLWKGSVTADGYGRMYYRSVGKRMVVRAHRLSFAIAHGRQPGPCLDHLCRNRLCCNPAHLEEVTNRENVLRGMGPTACNARKTVCKRGHDLTGDRVSVVKPKGRRSGERRCLDCMIIHNRARRKKLKMEANNAK